MACFLIGNHEKVKELDKLVTTKCGFARTYGVTGQTYSRHVDVDIVSALTGLGVSAHKVGAVIIMKVITPEYVLQFLQFSDLYRYSTFGKHERIGGTF